MMTSLWWWIPRYGMLGAACAQLATQCIMAVFLITPAWREKRQSG
jgi:hypothetical protein